MKKPYYQDEWVTQYCSDALTILRGLESDTVDLLCTDPPYGIGFMGKDWDKALPDKKIWAECFRVLKPGAFAFVMSIPRSDCLSRMVINLEDAGFRVDFTPIYWTYASGFPKAQNIGKAVDKRLGAEREVIGKSTRHVSGKPAQKTEGLQGTSTFSESIGMGQYVTAPSTPQAKALDGSYGGFQPKPAVEVIIVCMKPLSEKTFVDQALKNRKGITWLDDCRIPTNWNEEYPESWFKSGKQLTPDNWQGANKKKDGSTCADRISSKGRFPANLLVSDDVLNDGRIRKSTGGHGEASRNWQGDGHTISMTPQATGGFGDSGSFSRYFDLDKWAQTLPFLIVPKASKSEKNKGITGELNPIPYSEYRENFDTTKSYVSEYPDGKPRPMNKAVNNHPTVKPLKLMTYLITLGSRAGDIVLDPFSGSGTIPKASRLLNRKCVSVELKEKYCEIAAKRCSQSVMNFWATRRE